MEPRRPLPRLSRRTFLSSAALGMAAGSPVLAACARDSASSTGGDGASTGALQIASPDNPVTWPISDDNPMIESGLEPERNAKLIVYNYPDYLAPRVINSFEEKYARYGVKVEVTTFNDYQEALAKIRSGTAPYDVFLPSYDAIAKLVTAGLIRPLNHDYLPHIKDVWPEFQDPFYDGEWRYTVPYNVYTTGIGWRTDRVKEDIAARENPWDVFWDKQYASRLSVIDDYRETISMAMLRAGHTDINTGDPEILQQVSQDLTELSEATKPKVTITQYTDLPEGRLDLVHAWNGDVITGPFYLPSGESASVLRYWYPEDGRGVVNNDLMTVASGGKNPVLAHLFLDHVLTADVALDNFAWVGYQPPQVGLTPEKMVDDGLVPEALTTAIVRPENFRTGYRLLELPPEVDSQWQQVWQQFKAGG